MPNHNAFSPATGYQAKQHKKGVQIQPLDLPASDTNLKVVLQQLNGLTPGVLTLLERQHRFRPINDVNALKLPCKPNAS